jgi:hypothetical protein
VCGGGSRSRSLPRREPAQRLGKIHPLTGPVEVEGAEPGDVLEVEVLDVSPLVDFGYVVVSPALGPFGSLRPALLAPSGARTADSPPSPAMGTWPKVTGRGGSPPASLTHATW